MINLVSKTIASKTSANIEEFLLETVFSEEISEKELVGYLQAQVPALKDVEISQKKIEEMINKEKIVNPDDYNKIYHIKLSSLQALLKIIGLFGDVRLNNLVYKIF